MVAPERVPAKTQTLCALRLPDRRDSYLDSAADPVHTSGHLTALIQSGGGTGPMKPRQPISSVPMPDR